MTPPPDKKQEYVMVPVEPTEKMLHAVSLTNESLRFCARAIYKAMIAARPDVPVDAVNPTGGGEAIDTIQRAASFLYDQFQDYTADSRATSEQVFEAYSAIMEMSMSIRDALTAQPSPVTLE